MPEIVSKKPSRGLTQHHKSVPCRLPTLDSKYIDVFRFLIQLERPTWFTFFDFNIRVNWIDMLNLTFMPGRRFFLSQKLTMTPQSIRSEIQLKRNYKDFSH